MYNNYHKLQIFFDVKISVYSLFGKLPEPKSLPYAWMFEKSWGCLWSPEEKISMSVFWDLKMYLKNLKINIYWYKSNFYIALSRKFFVVWVENLKDKWNWF